jgi:hypothetical protein
LRKCVCIPPIRPFPFSLFGWVFVCDLRKCVCTPPNQTPPLFSLWFFIYLFDYLHSIHMNVCATPVKPLLFLSMNFFIYSQLSTHKCVYILLNWTPPSSLWEFPFFGSIIKVQMHSPLLDPSFPFSLSQLLTIRSSLCVFPLIKPLIFFLYIYIFYFINYPHKMCVFPLSNISFSFINYSRMNVCALPLSNPSYF